MFRKFCGDDTLKHIVIVTNMWGEGSQAKGVMRKAELKNKFYKQALNRGAQMLWHDNTVEPACNTLQHIVRNQLLPFKIQCELVDEKKDRRLLHRKSRANFKKIQEEMKGSNLFSLTTFANLLLRSAPDERRRG